MNRKVLAIVISASAVVAIISTAILTLHPNSPLKAETTYTVSIRVRDMGPCTAAFFQDGNMKTYCSFGLGGATINLNEGFYDVKIYHSESGRFKEEFEIFVCRNITITIRK